MTETEALLIKFQQNVQNELRKACIKSTNDIQHNHPPLRFLVPDCEYCKKYGNEFSNRKFV